MVESSGRVSYQENAQSLNPIQSSSTAVVSFGWAASMRGVSRRKASNERHSSWVQSRTPEERRCESKTKAGPVSPCYSVERKVCRPRRPWVVLPSPFDADSQLSDEIRGSAKSPIAVKIVAASCETQRKDRSDQNDGRRISPKGGDERAFHAVPGGRWPESQ